MVRLKKTHSQSKMATYHVGLQINAGIEQECEMRFSKVDNLKCLMLEFENMSGRHLYLKDIEIIFENETVDVVQLRNQLINGMEIFNIRFGSIGEKELFLETGFPDRMQDSGRSSSRSTTPSPPNDN